MNASKNKSITNKTPPHLPSGKMNEPPPARVSNTKTPQGTISSNDDRDALEEENH
jgi:hypothetical protein